MYFVLENRFKTFVDTLFEACENDPDFTDDDIRDEVITMMFAVTIFRQIYLLCYYYHQTIGILSFRNNKLGVRS